MIFNFDRNGVLSLWLCVWDDVCIGWSAILLMMNLWSECFCTTFPFVNSSHTDCPFLLVESWTWSNFDLEIFWQPIRNNRGDQSKFYCLPLTKTLKYRLLNIKILTWHDPLFRHTLFPRLDHVWFIYAILSEWRFTQERPMSIIHTVRYVKIGWGGSSVPRVGNRCELFEFYDSPPTLFVRWMETGSWFLCTPPPENQAAIRFPRRHWKEERRWIDG